MKTKRVKKDNPSKSNAKANAAFFAFVTFAGHIERCDFRVSQIF